MPIFIYQLKRLLEGTKRIILPTLGLNPGLSGKTEEIILHLSILS